MAIESKVHNYRKGPVALVDMDTCMKNEASMDGVMLALNTRRVWNINANLIQNHYY